MTYPTTLASSLYAAMTGNELPMERIPAAVGGINICAHQEVNTIDPGVHSAAIVAGGTVAFPNQIGVSFVGESPAYVAGTASYAFVAGAYDTINNQIAGTAIGPHHRLHAGGNHGAAIGGSTLSILGGSYNTLVGGGGAAQGNSISGAGSNSAIVGGFSHSIASAGNGSAIVGGSGVTLSSSGSYNGALACQSVTISGTAQNAVAFGSSHTITHSYTLTAGTQCIPVGPGTFTFSGASITEAGDCQRVSGAFKARTTNATLTNMSLSAGTAFLELDDTKTTAFTFVCTVTGIDEATKAMCSYRADICGYWDGTNLYFDDSAAAATGPATSGERNFATTISDSIGVAAVPTLALSTGSLRVKVTGKAATNIRWIAVFDFGMVKF